MKRGGREKAALQSVLERATIGSKTNKNPQSLWICSLKLQSVINLDISCLFQESASNRTSRNLISHPQKKTVQPNFRKYTLFSFSIGEIHYNILLWKVWSWNLISSVLSVSGNLSPSGGFLGYFHPGESLPNHSSDLTARLYWVHYKHK